MEEWTRSSPRLEDIPELIQRIQTILPVKEAARTSVLSKSWLYAWLTIPTLRFREALISAKKEYKGELSKAVDSTLRRYLRDNIPIESIDHRIDIENQESASFTEKWIQQVTIKSCLIEFSLEICIRAAFLTLPDAILSSKNLTKISVSRCLMARHPVINCMSLQELDLHDVGISEDVLDDIFSTCSLLVKIQVSSCKGIKTIKVKNLHCLYELSIQSDELNLVPDISDVPNIRLFTFWAKPLPFNLDSLTTVTELSLGRVTVKDGLLDIIQSKFPFLESLTLELNYCTLESYNFTCVTLKKLSITRRHHLPISIKVYAPILVSFKFNGMTMPSLLFSASVLEKIELNFFLTLLHPLVIDESFFLKMMEALTSSRKSNIKIGIENIGQLMPSFINADHLRIRVAFPAINVQKLSIQFWSDDKGFRGLSQFCNALFSTCHPLHVVACTDLKSDDKYFSQLLVREVMEMRTSNVYWRDHLKDVEIRCHCDGFWETLTDSWRSFLDRAAVANRIEFKLNWG